MTALDLRIAQLDQSLAPWKGVAGNPPQGGWLRAIREALGMTTRQAAKRARVSQSTWVAAEHREAAGTISLGQLRRFGAALDCGLFYALIPAIPLRQRVDAQAEALARAEVASVAHSMALEEQRTDDAFIAAQIEERKREILRGRRSRLWD